MMVVVRGWIDRLGGKPDEPVRYSLDEYVQQLNQFAFNGIGYGFGGQVGIQQSMPGRVTVPAPNNYAGLATHAYGANAVVFACMSVRMSLFSSVRFQFQNFRNGKPSDTFGNQSLRLLEEPWIAGTTQDLIIQMAQHTELGGNAYVARIGGELVVMRPDWVEIVIEERAVRGGRGRLVAVRSAGRKSATCTPRVVLVRVMIRWGSWRMRWRISRRFPTRWHRIVGCRGLHRFCVRFAMTRR